MASLKDELILDPLLIGYDGMSDAEVVVSLDGLTRSRNRDSMTGSELLNNVDHGEWNALSADQQRLVWDIVHMGTIDPFGVEETLLKGVFGIPSVTITALALARVEAISRATELGLGHVREGDVQRARAV
jgi:hypothetical protein